MSQKSREFGILRQENKEDWMSVPGKNNITTHQIFNVYECLNYDDVIFNGQMPDLMMYGPFYYREHMNYTQPENWDVDITVPGQSKSYKGIYMNQNFHSVFDEVATGDNTDDFNIRIRQLNNAAQIIWHTKVNQLDWELSLQVVLEGLGKNLVKEFAHYHILKKYVTTIDSINRNFMPNNPASQIQLDSLYSDHEWGLRYLASYQRWESLSYDAEPVEYYSIQNELRDHFGLSIEQIQETQQNWNKYMNEGKQLIYSQQTSDNKGDQAVAYWQWADSHTTRDVFDKDNRTNSTTERTETVTGFPELAYFKNQYLLPILKEQNKKVYDEFKDIELFEDRSQSGGKNYEYLLNLTSSGDPPDETSLFNIDTLKKLNQAGSKTMDLFENPTTDLEYLGLNFLNDVTKTLKLNNNRQTYLIYLWLKYCQQLTYNLDQISPQVRTLAELGSKAIKYSIRRMEQELPVLIFSKRFRQVFDYSMGCPTYYVNNFGFPSEIAFDLCHGGKLKIMTFSFQDQLTTCKAWINIYFNGFSYDPEYYADLVFLTGYNDDQIKQILYSDKFRFKSYMTFLISNPIYLQYKNNCSLKYAPELGYYLDKSGQEQFNLDFKTVNQLMKKDGLFCKQIIANILISQQTTTYSNAFNTDQFRKFLRYITLEEGLKGLYVLRTPNETIGGYIDPLFYQYNQIPVYMGGNQTHSTEQSYKSPRQAPSRGSVAFFTGADGDYLEVKKYARWQNHDDIVVIRKSYDTIWDLDENNAIRPWSQIVYLDGTDSYQFHPDVSEDETLSAFSPLLCRVIQFQYLGRDKQNYGRIQAMKFKVADYFMMAGRLIQDNIKFWIQINNTQPLQSIYDAPVLASKGNFLNLDSAQLVNIPSIITVDYDNVTPDPIEDDSYITVDRYSGLTLIRKIRNQFNMQIMRIQLLFDFIDDQDMFIVPFFYHKRETVLSKQQAQDLLGDLYSNLDGRITGLVTFIISGSVLLVISMILLCCYKKTKRLEILGIDDKYENLEEAQIGDLNVVNTIITTNSSRHNSKYGN
ncbi:scavenger receptor class member 2 [Stylonychia lemnae]|uniref:Scavenger receptor class member 2 n=1 Tax=Stylonychia lemnae TaxID=5949 RepID=A0A077ZXF7_STYLE|nr:scavenger receptor class member 2 [Stylonychia lemnae]|eukprot:CDW73912.1 scavenger receptor class member 2 [Stylonychia lemnae]